MRNSYIENNDQEKLTSNFEEFTKLLQKSGQEQQKSFIEAFCNFHQFLKQPQQQTDAVKKLYTEVQRISGDEKDLETKIYIMKALYYVAEVMNQKEIKFFAEQQSVLSVLGKKGLANVINSRPPIELIKNFLNGPLKLKVNIFRNIAKHFYDYRDIKVDMETAVLESLYYYIPREFDSNSPPPPLIRSTRISLPTLPSCFLEELERSISEELGKPNSTLSPYHDGMLGCSR